MNDELLEFTKFLKHRLRSKLPGREAQMQAVPRIGEDPDRDLKPDPKARRSAVLIPMLPANGSFDLLFTLRSDRLPSHPGQISFPGGRAEKYETPEQTALREAREEIALKESGTEVLGRLTDLFVPPSMSTIAPIVARIDGNPEFVANPAEVAEIFRVPARKFLDESIYKFRDWDYKGRKFTAPYWEVHTTTPLWGATAMILSEFLELYREFLSSEI